MVLVAGCSKLHTRNVTLKDAFKNDFLIGVAVNRAVYEGRAPREAKIVETQFDSISPENDLKWEIVHPAPGIYDFTNADRYVAFGLKYHMFIIGHNLIWHHQVPDWVFQDAQGNPISRDALIARMRDHIFTVVGRYKGKIGGWDVVNEALSDNGALRDTPWKKIIGDDYLVLAYQFAHEADPHAQLYYNDFALDSPAKRAGAIALVKNLQARGIKIYAVGTQEHDGLDPNRPSTNSIAQTINAFAKLGVKVMITELDINVLPSATNSLSADISLRMAADPKLNPYVHGLPPDIQQKLAQRYADLFSVFVAHRGEVSRVTFWGVTDADSWLNNWPVPGRTDYPLLFDRNCRPKPAFQAVLRTASH